MIGGKSLWLTVVFCVVLAPGASFALPVPNEADGIEGLPMTLAQARRTCKQVRDCREAVELWCGGYSRADADKDGIPCENVCRTKEEVDEIREQIGC